MGDHAASERQSYRGGSNCRCNRSKRRSWRRTGRQFDIVFAGKGDGNRARTAEDVKKELRAAEETLTTLSKTYTSERVQRITESVDRATPDEFRPLMRDIDSGKPMEVALENESRRNEEKDRGLSPEDRLANINARTERKKRFLEALNSIPRELQDPKSAIALALQRSLESLDSTKELRKQEHVVARLRQEVQALESTGK